MILFSKIYKISWQLLRFKNVSQEKITYHTELSVFNVNETNLREIK